MARRVCLTYRQAIWKTKFTCWAALHLSASYLPGQFQSLGEHSSGNYRLEIEYSYDDTHALALTQAWSS